MNTVTLRVLNFGRLSSTSIIRNQFTKSNCPALVRGIHTSKHTFSNFRQSDKWNYVIKPTLFTVGGIGCLLLFECGYVLAFYTILILNRIVQIDNVRRKYPYSFQGESLNNPIK